ncbi:MAG: ATPase, T2SS/T4P/T4SS family [Actinomycetota bacterium]|nr:ATPase, T2SS/T4P/T4SS family [Actinomycetota bacterium]
MSTSLRDALHRRLLDTPFDPEQFDRPELRSRLETMLRDEDPLCPAADAARVLDALVDEVGGLGPLEPLMADGEVTEIMLNGPGRAFVERRGRLVAVDLDLDATTIARMAQRIVAPLGLRLDQSSPLVDARLPDGSRVHAVLPPLAPDGPCLTIRRFTVRDVTLAAFGLDERAVALCGALVRGGWNLLVAGATSAGKTTLCNALARAIDPSERIVTIEETTELRLGQPHVVRLEARPANAEGVGAVSVRDLVRASLRMRPDRIVVGEVRGGEALDMLQALNTGHDGSLSTVHANGTAEALTRLETLALCADIALPLAAIRAQIAAAIDAVVAVARTPEGARVVTEVAEVEGGDPLSVRPLLQRGPDGLRVVAAPVRSARRPGVDLAEVWNACTPS